MKNDSTAVPHKIEAYLLYLNTVLKSKSTEYDEVQTWKI